MTIKESNPKGFCQSCKYPKMKIGGEWTCPNCSTKEQKGSGIISRTKDPGHEYFLTEDNIYQGISAQSTGNPSMCIPQKEAEEKVAENSIRGYGSWTTSLNCVYQFLHNQPIASLPHAKQLLKLKKKVLALQNDIKLFLDQK
jgi:hypothetical protein